MEKGEPVGAYVFVFGHDQKHFPKCFRLSFFAAVLDFAQFSAAINKKGDIISKKIPYIIYSCLCIFNSVMQKPGCNRHGVHVHIGKDCGNSQRMLDKGFSAHSSLLKVRLA